MRKAAEGNFCPLLQAPLWAEHFLLNSLFSGQTKSTRKQEKGLCSRRREDKTVRNNFQYPLLQLFRLYVFKKQNGGNSTSR